MTWRHASLLCAVVPVLLVGGKATGAEVNRDSQLARDIGQAQLAREEMLATYTATERYTIQNSRFSDPAITVVGVTYRKGAGKVYRVISRQGPAFLQSRVIDRILKEETEMSRGEARKASLVTEANYGIKWLGEQILEGRKCDLVGLEPRAKSPHLLRGQAWVDAASHNLIRIEGAPTASPSFWAGTPQVTREYVEIGPFSFAKRSHVVCQNFLLGRTELNIEYRGYRVNGAAVQ